MILQRLAEYYQRLADDPQQDVAPAGYSRQKIAFCVVLSSQGELRQFEDMRQTDSGTPRPQVRTVPGQTKPAGSGINPGFLWDKPQYLLGFVPEDDKPDRTARAFAAFRESHLKQEEQINDEAFSAVCRFLEQWDPAMAAQYPLLNELTSGYGVFRIEAEQQFVHERPTITTYWQNLNSEEDGKPVTGISLLSGERGPIARLHVPRIKGVTGAQMAGAALISYNCDAFTSYGKTQSYNAPLTQDEAFRYATALNRLLADRSRSLRIGDATVIYWSQRPTPFEDEFGPVISERAEDPKTLDSIHAFFNRLRQGRDGGTKVDADVPFYVLGLSPNRARLAVRFWLSGTVGQFTQRLAQHLADLEMIGARPDAPPLMISSLLAQTVRRSATGKPDYAAISPLLGGEVTRAVLGGGDYPQTLFTSVIRRIRADRCVDHPRVAVLKACLARRIRLAGQPKEIPVSLNKDHPDQAYHMGRLFAALEKVQEDASGGRLNSTIKDRYFSSASATPAGVFPRLMRLHQHHLNKVDNPGLRITREKLIQEICDHLTEFPSHLPLAGQGLFCIAYYQQRQDFFTKHNSTDSDPNTPTTQETQA